MINNNFENTKNEIRIQIDLLKNRLDNINNILNIQEEAINELVENTKTLLKEAVVPSTSASSIQEIMKKAFSKGRLPNILLN